MKHTPRQRQEHPSDTEHLVLTKPLVSNLWWWGTWAWPQWCGWAHSAGSDSFGAQAGEGDSAGLGTQDGNSKRTRLQHDPAEDVQVQSCCLTQLGQAAGQGSSWDSTKSTGTQALAQTLYCELFICIRSEDIHLQHPRCILKALSSINFTSKFSANQTFLMWLSSVLFSHTLPSKMCTSRHFKL